MQVVPLQCPLCTGLIQIDASLAGQQVACPLCQQAIQLPPAEFFAPQGPPAPPELPAPAPSDLVQMACPVCAGWLAVPAALSGQQVGCPHCASPILIGPLASPPREFPGPESRETAPLLVSAKKPSGKPATTAKSGNERLPPASKPSERLPPGKSAPAAPRADRLPPNQSPERVAKLPSAAAPDVPAAGSGAESPATVELEAAHAQEARAAAASEIAALLPPGAEDWRPAADEQPGQESPKRSKRSIDDLLPPGADGSAGAMPGEQVEIPDAPRRRPAIAANLPQGTVAVPTPDGGFVTVTESPAVIGEGDEEIEIRRLTPAEKARRRFRRNLILWSVSILILLAVTWWLVGR